MEDDHERVVSVTSLSVQLFTVPTMVSTPLSPLHLHTPVSLCLSLSFLLVELWALAEWLCERRPRPWVLHHWPVSTNIHRPIAGEFTLTVCPRCEMFIRYHHPRTLLIRVWFGESTPIIWSGFRCKWLKSIRGYRQEIRIFGIYSNIELLVCYLSKHIDYSRVQSYLH